MKRENKSIGCKRAEPVPVVPGPPAWTNAVFSARASSGLPVPIAARARQTDIPEQVPEQNRGDALDECVEPPEPCGCGSLAFWWDLLGGLHCMRCEPATASRTLLRRAAAIRQREAERSAAR
jgi:hypothetical protein